MGIDQVISLLSSIGACLAALAAFLTIRQMVKQRKASYMPDMAFLQTRVYGYTGGLDGSKSLADQWYQAEIETGQDLDFGEMIHNHFYLTVFNVGLGVAKQVSIRWELGIESWVAEVNARAQRWLVPVFFEYKNGMVDQKSTQFGNATFLWINEKSQKFGHVTLKKKELA